MMFTPESRNQLRLALLDRAAKDPRIEAAALTGSASIDQEDRWSDVDLAFSIHDPSQIQSVIADWTTHLYENYGALHHLDIPSGAWTYRVFLLPGALQLDLAFAPGSDFRALAPTFRLVFGTSREPSAFPAQTPDSLIAFGWLYALHARACIARNRPWQAEYMISGVRDYALALACVNSNLPSIHGRGFHLLPDATQARFEEALVTDLTVTGLTRAFHSALDLLLEQTCEANASLASRLEETVSLLKLHV